MNRIYQNHLKNDFGFTLLELIVYLGICQLVIVPLYTMLNYCVNSSQVAEEKEDLILNSRYAIEYMKNEIKEADEIISVEKIKDPNDKYSKNFGFVIKEKIELDESIKFNRKYENKYIIYYISGDCLRRDVAKKKSNELPRVSEFSGNNTIVENIGSIDESYTDFEGKKIVIKLLFKGKWNRGLKVSTEIYIRSPINY